MNRKLEVGDTLGQVFSTYAAEAGVLLPVAFWLFLIVAIVNGVIGKNLALFPIELAVSTIAATLYQGMVVSLVRDVQDGRRDSSIGELIRSAMPVLLPLIGAGLLSGLAIGVGTVLFIVPGLILLTIWAVIAPVIVVERSGVFASFGRSRQLVRGKGWPVFGVIVVAFAIAIVGGLIFNAIAAGISDGVLIRIVFTAIASTITAPITALAAAVLYFRLRAIGGGPELSSGDQASPRRRRLQGFSRPDWAVCFNRITRERRWSNFESHA
jgi:hypothetical protein